MIPLSLSILLGYLLLFSPVTFGYKIDLNEKNPVILATVITRHGDRNINNHTYPFDTLKDRHKELWPGGYLELTNKGKQDQYELGRYLRKRYDTLLGDKYMAESVYALSTDTNRCIMSAQCLLAGLFPPKTNQIWNPNILWQPIPVHSYEEKSGNVIKNYDSISCPKYFKEMDKALNSPEYAKLMDKYKKIMDHLTKFSGDNIDEFIKLALLHDYIKTQVEKNLSIPEWAQQIYPEPWTSAALRFYTLPTFTEELKRLYLGPLIKEITEQFEAKISGNSTRKFSLYSGHGDNVANPLILFKVFNWVYPQTSSAVLLELRTNNDSNYFITISLKNSTNEAFLFEIPGCGELCSWEQFKNIVSPYIPNDWDKECSLLDSNSSLIMRGGYISVLPLIVSLMLEFYSYVRHY